MKWPKHTSQYIKKNVDIKSRAGQVILFIETLKIPDGSQAGQPFKLADFQVDWLLQVYTDERVVTTGLASIPRKNGKTAFIAALLLCHLCGPEAIAFGQLYSIAFDRGQASVVYNLARNMVVMDGQLSNQIQIKEYDKSLSDSVSRSVFKALSSEGRAHHGKSSSFLVFDELAQFGSDDEMFSVMQTSTGAHGGKALTWIISTQAPDDQALLSQLIDRYKDNHNPKFKVFLHTAPDGADPFDEQTWRDCNPALDAGFRSLEELQESAKRAKEIPSLQARFENLYLNRRISAEAFFVAPQVWKENGGELPNINEFEGRSCYAGLDLSQKNDLSALVLYFPMAENETRDSIFSFFWKPGDSIQEHARRDIVPYPLWVQQGYIETTPGSVIDYRNIVERLAWVDSNFDLLELGFDRWKVADLQKYANDADLYLNMREIGQGFKDMSPCCEALEDVLLQRRVNHGNNPVLTWCASNAVAVQDPAGARKLDKSKSRNRIDGMVALVMACRLATIADDEADYFG